MTYIDLKDINPDANLSEHFTAAEVLRESTFSDNDNAVIADSLFPIAELVREKAGGTPVSINSAFRNFVPPGGSKNSAHLRGNALDIGLNKKQRETLKSNLVAFMEDAFGLGLKGFGVYSWGVHIDVDTTLPIKNEWGIDDTVNKKGAWYGPIRFWGQPWLKKNGTKEVSVLMPNPDSIGHTNEMIPDRVKALSIYLLPLSLIAAYFIYKRFKK